MGLVHKNTFTYRLLFRWILYVFNVHEYITASLIGAGNFSSKFEIYSLFGQDPLEEFSYFAVYSSTADRGKKLYRRNFRSETFPYGALKREQSSRVTFVRLDRSMRSLIQLTNSNPITPAPISTNFFGTSVSDNAPVEDTI